ncbi:plasmid stabilization protein [Rhizobium sp. FY34]|uniref:FitA-like ribbon-helix-helix domain-containing protein n=1 Tax=Rhizobium sp. FY34 TaxID=2562309 RepID=UPI0010BFA2C8|nr:plasmid stabilization protein [Rhizobium sp. FY34]
MPAVTIRNLSEATHRALKARASHNGRSTEAEIRDILDAAVRPDDRLKIGTFLSQLGRSIGLTDHDVAALRPVGEGVPAKPLDFE